MQGLYRFFKSGELVHTQSNIITTQGQAIIAKYLAGTVQSWAGSIALGSLGTAAALGDIQLGFEYGRSDVQLRNPRYMLAETTPVVLPARWEVVLRAEVDPLISGSVYEVGLFNNSSNSMTAYPRIVLTTFNPNQQFITGGDSIQYTAGGATNFMRAGEFSQRLILAASTTGTISVASLNSDLSGYRAADTFSVAYHQTAGGATVALRFHTDDANFYSASFTGVNGYNVAVLSKSAFVATGTPSWSNITSVRLFNTATATGSTIYFDAVSADDKSATPEYALVSRSVLASPIVKGFGEHMDIEYAVNLLG